ncbi:MAG: Alkaline phosphatase [Caulobacteraceae bacterium]|nr:Alkaline phosphatase [Caulobacteraceae bacterium]
MRVHRRGLLALLGAGVAAPAWGAQAGGTFKHGVASGDPRSDSVILWTRASPADPAGGPLDMAWEVSSSSDFGALAARGRATAGADRDFTVKVEATGLKPGQDYFYRFRLGDVVSPVGRMRTAPTGPLADAVIVNACCANYASGYYNAYRAMADLPRLDLVVFMGDYIYETGPGGYGTQDAAALGRTPDPPKNCITLADYRLRYAQHRTDKDLQDAHARCAWIATWDDHEFADNATINGASGHNPTTEGAWADRKAAAVRAYYEWMPLREPAAGIASFGAINRSFAFGDLFRLIMLETRMTARGDELTVARDAPMVNGQRDNAAFLAKLDAPERRMLSADQEAWLETELRASVRAGEAWQLLGSSVPMARVRQVSATGELAPLPHLLDAWDGYPAARARVYDRLKSTSAHALVLSGDSHAWWMNELFDTPGGKRLAAEASAGPISSPATPAPANLAAFIDKNDEVLEHAGGDRGFIVVTMNHDRARIEWKTVSTVAAKPFEVRTAAAFEVRPAVGGGVEAVKKVQA